MSPNDIFISYAWKGASEALVDRLCAELEAHGHTVRRDKSTMTYRDSIRSFMDRIGRGKFIIAVVNDKYMKSEYCMYEAYRMFQSPAFRERVFPIVLPDADIFSFHGQAAYLKHWDQTYREIEAEYREIALSSPTMVAPLTERLRDIEATTRFINDFMAAVGDMNVLTSDIHLESNFTQLIAAIEEKMAAANSQPEDASPSPAQERPPQTPTGGGVIIGGSVHTGGGDFIGRDKMSITYSGQSSPAPVSPFPGFFRMIEQFPGLPPEDRADLIAEAHELEAEYLKGQEGNEAVVVRRLRNLKRISPELCDRILDALLDHLPAPDHPVFRAAVKVKAAG